MFYSDNQMTETVKLIRFLLICFSCKVFAYNDCFREKAKAPRQWKTGSTYVYIFTEAIVKNAEPPPRAKAEDIFSFAFDFPGLALRLEWFVENEIVEWFRKTISHKAE